ncbi:MAG: leucyl aminopeptidase [Halomonadaceae bacterium]|nr:MAG: leucyl aminopeptidase [Halomonadaceae bacterium]
MEYQLECRPLTDTRADCLIVAVPESGEWPTSTQQADELTGGLISQLHKGGDFSGKQGTTQLLPLAQGPWQRLLLVGAGKAGELNTQSYCRLVASAIGRLKETGAHTALAALADIPVLERDEAWRMLIIARVCEETLYQFQQYKSEQLPLPKLTCLQVLASGDSPLLAQALTEGQAIGEGMNLARDMGNTPPNICHPVFLAEQAKALAKTHKVIKTQILDEDQMAKLGMNALLSVSLGSIQPARLIIMEYRGGDEDEAPHVLVGKGITFDTGGISLKAGAGMDEMKYDMCGAASVLGTMHAVASLKPQANIIGVIAAAENMPSDRATRPGDIVTSMSGQTIEVLNTDAEGRMVLSDALTYVERFKPASVVDIATLTGACIVALGDKASAVMGNNDSLVQKLLRCGQQSGDRVWELPLWDEYQRQLDSNFADMQNIGGKGAGSITAGCFLSRFATAYPWAHLDVAGTAWLSGKEKGATGRPVPLLMEYLLTQAG